MRVPAVVIAVALMGALGAAAQHNMLLDTRLLDNVLVPQSKEYVEGWSTCHATFAAAATAARAGEVRCAAHAAGLRAMHTTGAGAAVGDRRHVTQGWLPAGGGVMAASRRSGQQRVRGWEAHAHPFTSPLPPPPPCTPLHRGTGV